jgi:predicted RNA methylase
MQLPSNKHFQTELKKIANTILAPEQDFFELTQAVESWKEILFTVTGLDLKEEKCRENIHSETGKAIGTTWAAMCLDDLLRTKRFIRGVFQAVEQRISENKKQPVQLLYAGSGPFAPLVLLLTTRYSPQEVQFTLLEINENSYAAVKKVFETLKLEDYLREIHLCDATKFKLPYANDIDILISETMQRALVREQQVPITYNLLAQLREDIILIPEKIDLQLVLLNRKKQWDRNFNQNLDVEYHHPLGSFFELSKSGFKVNPANYQNASYRFPEKYFSLTSVNISAFDCLCVFTKIKIYNQEQLDINDSQLASPLILHDLERNPAREISINYKIDSSPGIEFKLI